MTHTPSFAAALRADGPCAEYADKLRIYGRLIGDWAMTARLHPQPGQTEHAQGEIHFGWILNGRAIQDVWNLPGFFHGTTLRIYDPAIDAWHIFWNEPFKQYYPRMIGRPVGAEIVQEGKKADGTDIRWRFTDIDTDGFRWWGERRLGQGWFMECEIVARRIASTLAG